MYEGLFDHAGTLLVRASKFIWFVFKITRNQHSHRGSLAALRRQQEAADQFSRDGQSQSKQKYYVEDP